MLRRPSRCRLRAMRRRPSSVAALSLLACAGQVLAAPDSYRAVVIANAASWASLRIVNEYAALRGIPPRHVILLDRIPANERVPVETFRCDILQPVFSEIQRRGLEKTVDTILWGPDIPTVIDVSGDLQGRTLPDILSPYASLNSLTFFAQDVLAGKTGYLSLEANPYARKFPGLKPDSPWTDEERDRFARALAKMKKPSPGDPSSPAPSPSEALALLAALLKSHPRSALLHYNLACAQTLAGQPDAALASLKRAIRFGWSDARTMQLDEDLASLRKRKDFAGLVKQLQDLDVRVSPHLPFTGASGGVRYWLSAVLACTSGRGTSTDDALEALRRAAAADGTCPGGTVYYMKNSDIRSTTRQWAFASAVRKLASLGVEACVMEGFLPTGKTDVAGLMIGSADLAWRDTGSSLLPGAIAEHLTSWGGLLTEEAGQTPLTELLVWGAAGASGTVSEPYALQGKFPNAFIHWFYAQGANLAEAFYESVTGPYQLLIVGDGLCRPWAPPVCVSLATDPAPTEPLRGRVRINVKAAGPFASRVKGLVVLLDGEPLRMLRGSSGKFVWDTSQHDDGFHTLGAALSTQTASPATGQTQLEVRIANAVDAPWTIQAPETAAWDKPLVIDLALAGAESLVLDHAGYTLAQIAGGRGQVTLDPRRLGAGPITLEPRAFVQRGGRRITVHGRPLRLRVEPPAFLEPGQPPPLEDGIILTTGDGHSIPLDTLAKYRFQASHDRARTPFVLTTWVRTDTQTVYQVFLDGPARTAEVRVNGVLCDWIRYQASPVFVPLPLKAGWHELRVSGNAQAGDELDIRFGGPGLRRLAAPRFKRPSAARKASG